MQQSDNRIKNVVINYVAALSLIFFGYIFYSYQNYFRDVFGGDHDLVLFTISTADIFFYYVALNVLILPFFYMSLPADYATKSRLFWRAIFNLHKRKPDSQEKVAILGTLVKVFFIPLVLLWFFNHSSSVIWNLKDLFSTGRFFPNGYWFLFHLILFVDVLFFLIGYTIEHPKLKNEIRSVEPTLLGWVVALACYPPFNGAMGQMLGWYSSDYPEASDPILQALFGSLILLFMGLYAWASVALCFKASNLTNRGIVSSGPYAYVRHPAYAAKNLAWWVGSIPILYTTLVDKSFFEFCLGLFSVLIWTWIYYMRAITEERHLNSDPDYHIYCKKVHYKFIPRLW